MRSFSEDHLSGNTWRLPLTDLIEGWGRFLSLIDKLPSGGMIDLEDFNVQFRDEGF